jgi:hypothetical protein
MPAPPVGWPACRKRFGQWQNTISNRNMREQICGRPISLRTWAIYSVFLCHAAFAQQCSPGAAGAKTISAMESLFIGHRSAYRTPVEKPDDRKK